MEYVLLDARANDDPDDAIVYVACKDLAEALDYRQDFPDAVLAECHKTTLVVVQWPDAAAAGADEGEGRG